MDSFTLAYLAPIVPAKGSLESIGSVRAMHERANAETADNSDFGKFQRETDRHAGLILQMFGQEAYEQYVSDVAAQRQREQTEDAEELACRAARLRRFLDLHAKMEIKLTKLITKRRKQDSPSA